MVVGVQFVRKWLSDTLSIKGKVESGHQNIKTNVMIAGVSFKRWH